MKILVTGGAGFIGSHLAEYHLNRGDEVIVIDDLSSGCLENLNSYKNHPKFRFIQANLLHDPILEKVVTDVDRIYNMAAIVGMNKVLSHPLLTWDVNANVLQIIYRQLLNSKRKPLVIVASSSEVYGSQDGPLKETRPMILETTMKNHATYAVSKMSDEILARAYYSEHQIPSIILRIFNTIGPRQTGFYGMVVPRFVSEAIKNEPITVFGDGQQVRSFCDVRDLVEIIQKLADNQNAVGQVFNVGREEPVSIMELALLVKKLASSHSELTYIPLEKAYTHEYIEMVHREPNLTKLKKYINFTYQWSLKSTIENLIELGRKHEK